MKIVFFITILLTCSAASFGQNVERMFMTDAWVYLYQFGVPPNGPGDNFVRPVERTVPRDFQLRYALDAVFQPELSEREEEDGFVSPAYGLVFEGVSVKNGIATVRFSQPNDSNEGSLGPEVFAEAITKTARQFRSVKRVTICAVGKTTIDSELQRPFPRCPAKR